MEQNTHHHENNSPSVSSSNTPTYAPKKKWSEDYLLPLSILAAGILVSGSVLFATSRIRISPGTIAENSNVPAAGAVQTTPPELKESDVVLGDPKAPVTIFEFGDYQCPFCVRQFEETMPQIREQYVKTGKVKVVFRGFQFLGPESVAAAEAAECAKDQSKFWAYHDALYTFEGVDGIEHNGNLNRELFMKIAGNLKLDATSFGSCLDSGKYTAKVNADTEDAGKYGVQSTPTSFVNSQMILGAQPFDKFKAAIEAELAK